jgi:hypothetical protein
VTYPPVRRAISTAAVRLWAIALALVVVSACGSGEKGRPPVLAGIGPIQCSVNIDLKLSCSAGKEWVFGIGPVKVSPSFDGDIGTNGALIVLIRQLDETDQAWQIGTDDRPLCLLQSENVASKISNNVIAIAPQVGTFVRILDPIQTGQSCSAGAGVGEAGGGTGVTVVTVPKSEVSQASGGVVPTTNESRPQSQPQQSVAVPSPPIFLYPVDGDVLDLAGAYQFKVTAVTGAFGYLFGLYQDGTLVWENNRDEGSLSGTEYSIDERNVGHSRFHAGSVQVWARAYLARQRQWTEPRIITINLQPR